MSPWNISTGRSCEWGGERTSSVRTGGNWSEIRRRGRLLESAQGRWTTSTRTIDAVVCGANSDVYYYSCLFVGNSGISAWYLRVTTSFPFLLFSYANSRIPGSEILPSHLLQPNLLLLHFSSLLLLFSRLSRSEIRIAYQLSFAVRTLYCLEQSP